MTEGIVRIYLSYVEPKDKGLLWMRPYLYREGYELLYFGAKGWTPFKCCCNKDEGPKVIPGHTECNNGGLFEITTTEISCGCD